MSYQQQLETHFAAQTFQWWNGPKSDCAPSLPCSPRGIWSSDLSEVASYLSKVPSLPQRCRLSAGRRDPVIQGGRSPKARLILYGAVNPPLALRARCQVCLSCVFSCVPSAPSPLHRGGRNDAVERQCHFCFASHDSLRVLPPSLRFLLHLFHSPAPARVRLRCRLLPAESRQPPWFDLSLFPALSRASATASWDSSRCCFRYIEWSNTNSRAGSTNTQSQRVGF